VARFSAEGNNDKNPVWVLFVVFKCSGKLRAGINIKDEMKDNNHKKKCRWCGKNEFSYNSIFIPAKNKNFFICLDCYNKEISKSAGIYFENIQLYPVILKDMDNVDHEFHFSLRVMGEKLALKAFEVKGDFPTGYEFSMTGDTEDGIFPLFSNLYERMIKTLNRKHIFKNKDTDDWQITGANIVRGQISCNKKSIGYSRKPMMIIDGKEISWEDFGKMLIPYEGFNFRLQILDQNNEID